MGSCFNHKEAKGTAKAVSECRKCKGAAKKSCKNHNVLEKYSTDLPKKTLTPYCTMQHQNITKLVLTTFNYPFRSSIVLSRELYS